MLFVLPEEVLRVAVGLVVQRGQSGRLLHPVDKALSSSLKLEPLADFFWLPALHNAHAHI